MRALTSIITLFAVAICMNGCGDKEDGTEKNAQIVAKSWYGESPDSPDDKTKKALAELIKKEDEKIEKAAKKVLPKLMKEEKFFARMVSGLKHADYAKKDKKEKAAVEKKAIEGFMKKITEHKKAAPEDGDDDKGEKKE